MTGGADRAGSFHESAGRHILGLVQTRVRRSPQRGRYDRTTIDAVLDAQPLAHVAFVDAGQPYCVPMLHARIGDDVYVHGSSASRAMRALGDAAPACVTVTALDGLVLARSAFEHSANYRSVMLLGTFRVIDEPESKLAAFEAFTNAVVPGRWNEVRPPSASELQASTVLAMAIDAASAKVRTGPPTDDGSPDALLDVWAGVLPVENGFGEPVAAPGLRAGIGLARSVRSLLGGAGRGAST
ncbi:MAG: pyridoxamine 5'-phosphate oxidase family protein [Pseudonocardiales bacterium]|nr:MAG: pyridoxamine 5'-phosphate oxidase family protein [Pseudonocardiales bacterium]